MTSEIHRFSARLEDSGQRLDKFLVAKLPALSRSRIQALIEECCVLADGKVCAATSAKIKEGQRIEVRIPEIKPSHIAPQEIALDVIYEDDDILIINKPAGLTVHPAPGHPDMTLVNALLAHCGKTLSGIGGVARPGIVHRIDKDTSGLLVVAKHDAAHIALSAQLADRSLKRTYAALVWGVPSPKSGTIKGNIGRSMVNRQKMAVTPKGGKPAVTHYKVLEIFDGVSLVECNLETGRTHQIRVHFTHIKHPLIGDPVYGQSTVQRLKSSIYKSFPEKTRETLLSFNRQALHAKALELIHPKTQKKIRFECNLPDDMQSLITSLRGA